MFMVFCFWLLRGGAYMAMLGPMMDRRGRECKQAIMFGHTMEVLVSFHGGWSISCTSKTEMAKAAQMSASTK
jgi:hypothetical protein